MASKLYVGNLAYTTDEASLRELFEQIGEIADVIIIREYFNGQPGRSKGYGFVTMVNEADATEAVQKYNGVPFEGRNITVSEAKAKEASQPCSPIP